MRYVLTFVLVLVSLSSQNPVLGRTESIQQPQKQAQTAQQPASPEKRGTEETPFVVKTVRAPKTQEEVAQETKDRQEKASNDRNLVSATYILAAIAALQLFVFGYQAIQLKRTVRAAAEQGEDMKRAISETSRSASATEQVARHIEISLQTGIEQSESMRRSVDEATRLASAMEVVASQIALSVKAANESVIALRERTAQQMRAYLTVIVGGATYQEKVKGWKFEGKPSLVNTGHTPAHKVRYVARAEILPVPLPDDFNFPLPDDFKGSSVLGPQQNNQLFGIVDDFCDEAEVPNIKSASAGKGLYIWGVVHYEDIFGEAHFTKFCQLITWLPNNAVFGLFIPRHNEAT